MSEFISTILEHHFSPVLTDVAIVQLFPGSQDRRYGLVKRALAKGDLLHIKRGVYCLAKKFQKNSLNPFVLAQQIYGPSYVSLESALSYHGLIPEAVRTITCVCQKLSKEFVTPLGTFAFTHIPQNTFYLGVQRVPDSQQHPFLIATPLKALADYVYVYKKNWKCLSDAAKDLRLDLSELAGLQMKDFDLTQNYRSKRVKFFLNYIYQEMSHEHRLDSTET